MRFAICIPQLVDGNGFDPLRFRAYLARAEQLGFESAWVQEQLLGPTPILSPLETLSYAAACTERLRLGCAVLVTPLHSPVHLAREIATVDQLSEGRLEIGVVAGGRGRAYAAFGMSPDGAISRFLEGLGLMKALWAEQEVTLDGRFWRLDGDSVGLKPMQRPHPPIWFGGNHPDALRRAVRHGQGFIGAGSQSTSNFAEQVRVVNQLIEKGAKRNFQIAKRVYIAVDDDEERAKLRMGTALKALYQHLSANEALAFAICGPPEVCVTQLRKVADAGAQLILLNPLLEESAQMERLVAEVVPHLLEL